MTTDIKFDCAHCGQKMVAEDSAAGLAIECPSCSASIVIPRRASIHEAAPMMNGHAPHGRAHPVDAEEPEPELAALRQELTDASVQISRLEGEVAELTRMKAEKRKLRDDLVRLQRELAASDEAAREAQAARDEAERRLAALVGDFNRLEGELASEQQQGIRLRAEVDAYVAERTEVLPRLEAAERSLEELTQSLREREIEAQELKASLAETQAARTEALREIQKLEARLAEVGGELASARAAATQAEAEWLAVSEELEAVQKRLAASEEAAKSLAATVAELEKERAALSRSLSQDTAGRDLVATREQLGATTKERDRLALQVERLTSDLDSAHTRQRETENELRSALRELDEARRRAEAASEARLRRDNDVLRGIIARQNVELEQRHRQLTRLKRAQLAVRLAYAAFGIGLVLVAYWAIRVVPGLNLGQLF